MSDHVLLLTGSPGAGKTTAVRRVAAGLPHARLRGFLTEEILSRGARSGFRLTTFDGRAVTLAHANYRSPHRVGKYGVDVHALEGVVETALGVVDDALYLVDEIGKMECLSARFVAAMTRLLDSGRPVVATIALHGGGFIAEVKRRRDVELWEVTRADREDLPARVLRWLADRALRPAGR
jgi:nucleoside-triphosphatase